jgi:hypothetical protein
MDMGSLLATFYSLAGVSAVIALLVNTLKVLGVVKDGSAPIWSAGFNLLALVLLFALGVINPGADLVQVDSFLAQAAQIGGALLALVAQLWGSRLTHAAVRGIPVVGMSYSL